MKTPVWLLGLVAAVCVWGSEARDPMEICDENYAACTERCGQMDDAPVTCYDNCDKAYQKCLDIANGYPPEPQNVPEPKKEKAAPKEAASEPAS